MTSYSPHTMNPINSALSFCRRQLNLIDAADTRIKLDDAVGMKRSKKILSAKTIGKLQLIFNRELGLTPSATSIQETKTQVRRACTIVDNMKDTDAKAALLPLIATFHRHVDLAQEKWDLKHRIANAIQSHIAAAAGEDVSDDDSDLWSLADGVSDDDELAPPPGYSHAAPEGHPRSLRSPQLAESIEDLICSADSTPPPAYQTAWLQPEPASEGAAIHHPLLGRTFQQQLIEALSRRSPVTRSNERL